MYKKPSDECDFRQLKDYQRVVYNSFLTEDPDLFELIKKTHYDIYYVFDRTDLDVNNSIRLNNNVIDNEEDYILKWYRYDYLESTRYPEEVSKIIAKININEIRVDIFKIDEEGLS